MTNQMRRHIHGTKKWHSHGSIGNLMWGKVLIQVNALTNSHVHQHISDEIFPLVLEQIYHRLLTQLTK
ncbi:hypothetical protein LCGC14_0724010 [marine sediment metagenome]|uniref:Uncharacterized protein n=1 Tax=marine sediment metagenome TaxID=412755 RepID=A0A0F9QBN3_9ZZZZ